ncbi:MAG TPA: nucleotide sugar dehydrogenase [Kiloniellales bacterium]|nr:nucleotide sugar dehydrogenase [Kiloniellales bacterium]
MAVQPTAEDLEKGAETAKSERLLRAIDARTAAVGVIGLGYVGLPLAIAFARAGFAVTGFDTDPAKVARLAAGESYIEHIAAETLRPLIEAGRLAATDDFARLAAMDAVLICVPTPLAPDGEPDLSFVEGTARAVARTLRPGQLVVLESTTYPGTTRELLRPILEAGGLACERDFFLAYAPEREDPGNDAFETRTIPKVVGGEGPRALRLAETLYGRITGRTVAVSDTRTAEAAKLVENVFRAVNIALVNELKIVFDAMEIDVWEVIDAAATKPFGYMPFYPGPGLGGHCIPIDPFYLAWKARRHGVSAEFVRLAGEINTAMPNYVVGRLARALESGAGKTLSGAQILLLGMAYKKNVDDTRESPALVVMETLLAKGAEVDYHDPHVPLVPVTRAHPELAGRRSTALSPEAVAGYDALLLCTDHDAVDYASLAEHARLIVDTRNAFARRGLASPKIVKA